MDAKFSPRVRDVITFSREEALRLGHNYIGIEHILLGIIREGEGNAVKILQRLLREMGFDVSVDGVIGPQTLAAAGRAAVPEEVALRDAYGVARRNYYFRLADRRPASRKYARTRQGGKGGWILRAESFLSPRYHLSDAAFRQRVAAWD